MTRSTFNKPATVISIIALFLFLILNSAVSYGADQGVAANPDEIVAKLKGKLNLSDQQSKELKAALTDLSNQLDALIAKREAATEQEDPKAFINGVKQAQADYQNKLKTIFTASQLQSYNELREKVIMEAMDNLATIRLLDIQPHVKFSDAQMKKMVPVMAETMRSFIKIAWKYAGQRLRFFEKIRIAKDLKEIQSKAQNQIQAILTPDQYKAWEAYKKQMQSKEKSK
jgi:hypothetical protein